VGDDNRALLFAVVNWCLLPVLFFRPLLHNFFLLIITNDFYLIKFMTRFLLCGGRGAFVPFCFLIKNLFCSLLDRQQCYFIESAKLVDEFVLSGFAPFHSMGYIFYICLD
jgi:hypothetical protein